jgi:Peptidase inhibitor family I36
MHRMRTIALAAIASVGLALSLSSTAFAATGSASAPAAAHAVRPASPTGCPNGDFCTYRQPNGNGNAGNICVETSSGNHTWAADCANADESVYNGAAGLTRIYYRASGWTYGTSAWMCIDDGNYIDNLDSGNAHNNGHAYIYDQESFAGEAGFGQTLFNNAHSDEISTGSCTIND